MQSHPYLRAYMAGTLVPTVFLLVLLTVYTLYGFRLYAAPSAALPDPAHAESPEPLRRRSSLDRAAAATRLSRPRSSPCARAGAPSPTIRPAGECCDAAGGHIDGRDAYAVS